MHDHHCGYVWRRLQRLFHAIYVDSISLGVNINEYWGEVVAADSLVGIVKASAPGAEDIGWGTPPVPTESREAEVPRAAEVARALEVAREAEVLPDNLVIV